ncbi:Subunit of the glycosylphosphatidylinositol transamidase complex-like protein [Malassezia cuniculi]|uniref:Subunit of the glycosylphosphatidylinositol transamidase complex-like protein n=1 Tax=Malassezia cuniculi TaxID=948313 RepID=A0AAF0J9Y5_9BASI|nr:Subunit of the glycosylphosphatidylinositol transamidase complex-like protein [Malassezia cuniculi]
MDGGVQYDTILHEPLSFGRVRASKELCEAAALVESCVNLERRLHAAFMRLAELGVTDARLAIVTGKSLLFPMRTVVVSLVGALQPMGPLDDSLEMQSRRKRAASLLERRIVRALTESMEETPLAPTATRVLLCAPRNFAVEGWQPRPWKGAATAVPTDYGGSESDATDDASDGDDNHNHDRQICDNAAHSPHGAMDNAADASDKDGSYTAPASRMRLPQSIIDRRPRKQSYMRRKSKKPPVEIIISCGTSCTLPDAVWHECSTHLLRASGDDMWMLLALVAVVAQMCSAAVQVRDIPLEGTWSTGTGAVTTGPDFFNLVNNTFNIPKNSGQAYSFTSDGFWEQALYLYKANPVKPRCYTAQLIWQHGNYSINDATGELHLTPFEPDGRMQLYSPCNPDSGNNNVQSYAMPEYMKGFDITLKTHNNWGAYTLQLYDYNGALKPRMYLRAKPAQIVWADSFNESLTLRPLPGGRVHAAFTFELGTDENAALHHFGLLPRALLQPVASLGVRDMQLALNTGRWRYDLWGTPALAGGTESIASGADVWASFAPGEAPTEQRWRVLTSALASLICASLDAVDTSTTIEPLYNYFGASVAANDTLLHAYLPSEALCTENVAPLLHLLPCKGGAGLASLIQTHNILRTDFHGVSVKVRHEDGWKVSLGIQTVIASDDISFTSLFGRELERSCPLAGESTVRLAGVNAVDEDDPPATEFATSALVAREQQLSMDGLNMTPPGVLPLIATRSVLGYGQERNTVQLVLRNNLRTETVRVLYYDQIASFVQPLLHTIRAEATVDAFDEDDEVVHFADDVTEPHVVSLNYQPPVVRQRTGAVELELRVPQASTLTVTYELVKHMLHYEEHVPDPHRGRDLSPAVFVPLARNGSGGSRPRPVNALPAEGQAKRIYTPPSLVDVALPDFSMPYNVILFYSTYVALFFGHMLNLIMRTIRDVWVRV